MKKKKENWIKTKKNFWRKHPLEKSLMWILIWMLFYGLTSSFFYSTSYICSHNPEKCVCIDNQCFVQAHGNKGIFEWEKYSCNDAEYIHHTYNENISTKCVKSRLKNPCELGNNKYILDCPPNTNYNSPSGGCVKTYCRLKTSQELLIDDCNNNPREDKECKCENITIREGCIKSRLKTECEKKHFVQGKYVNVYGTNFQCLKCEIGQDTLNSGCFENPECYEGNPDWVGEVIYTYEISCDSPFVPCYRFESYYKDKQKALVMDSVYDPNAKSYNYTHIISNQTICREKTFDEKHPNLAEEVSNATEIS